MTHPSPEAKIAIVLDVSLPSGLAANTAAVLALTLGSRIDSLIGGDLKDADGSPHIGITTMPIPILTAEAKDVKNIRNRAVREHDNLLVVDFTDCAQRTRTYDDYSRLLGAATDEHLAYIGVALYGPRKLIQRLTGSLALLR